MSLTAIVIGAGDRGAVYSNHALISPQELKIVGVAEPDPSRRLRFASIHGLTQEQQFSDWKEILADKHADIAIITTPDHLHFDPVMRSIELGYHIFLEKPMAPTEQQCRELVSAAETHNVILQVGHVLRFTQFFSRIQEVISSGTIGELVSVNLSENVSYYHYAHSFIRGNWHNRATSSPMILAKSCHDLDILYWLANSVPTSINSYGSQLYFGQENKPRDTPTRCTDGCPIEDTCLYYAPRIYLDIIPILHIARNGGSLVDRIVASLVLRFPWLKSLPPFSRINSYSGWPVSVISTNPSLEARRQALEEGPYGRCVYDVADHDVVDHQVVSIEFANGVLANFTMHGHSSEEGRSIRVDGTKGTIIGEFKYSGNELYVIDSLTNSTEKLIREGVTSGHGGGDEAIMQAFLDRIKYDSPNHADGSTALMSHLMAFAADISRTTAERVDFSTFVKRSP